MRSKAEWKKRFVWHSLCLAATLSFSVITSAEDIHIRVIDARSGRAVQDGVLNVWLHETGEPISAVTQRRFRRFFVLSPDKTGTVRISVQPGENYISFFSGNHVDCREREKIQGGLRDPLYPVAEIVASGLYTENRCGKFKVQSKPGELVYFVRPWHWWEKLAKAFRS